MPVSPALAGLLACSHVHAAPPVAPNSTYAPTAAALAVHQALSVRETPPTCAEAEALTSTPVSTLLEIVDHATMPPWAPLRAATCLVERHGDETRAEIVAWVSDPDLQGLAQVALLGVDRLPVDLALEVARLGLAGPDPAGARKALERSANAEIQALLAR